MWFFKLIFSFCLIKICTGSVPALDLSISGVYYMNDPYGYGKKIVSPQKKEEWENLSSPSNNSSPLGDIPIRTALIPNKSLCFPVLQNIKIQAVGAEIDNFFSLTQRLIRNHTCANWGNKNFIDLHTRISNLILSGAINEEDYSVLNLSTYIRFCLPLNDRLFQKINESPEFSNAYSEMIKQIKNFTLKENRIRVSVPINAQAIINRIIERYYRLTNNFFKQLEAKIATANCYRLLRNNENAFFAAEDALKFAETHEITEKNGILLIGMLISFYYHMNDRNTLKRDLRQDMTFVMFDMLKKYHTDIVYSNKTNDSLFALKYVGFIFGRIKIMGMNTNIFWDKEAFERKFLV